MNSSLAVVQDTLARAKRWDEAAKQDEKRALELRNNEYHDVAHEFEESAKVHRRIAERERALASRIATTPLGG